MKKVFIFLVFICCKTKLFAQDTLSATDKKWMNTIGAFFKSQKNSVLAENELGGTLKDVLKNGTKQALKGTAQKTLQDMAGGNSGSLLNLPFSLQQNKELFIKKGKATLLNNFQNNLQQASQQALRDGMQIFIGSVFDRLVDNVMNIALAPSTANTDSMMLQQALVIKQDYKTNFMPFAKKAVKAYKLGKQARKIAKFLRKNDIKDNQFDLENLITNDLWDKVNGNIGNQLLNVKKNPLQLIEGLLQQ